LVEKELQKVIEVEDEDEVKHKVSIFKGRRITGAGQKLLDATAHELREVADGEFPGVDKY
jgi:ribosomal protein S19E (S16A)